MPIPNNVSISKINEEKVLVFQGVAFLGRVEKFNVDGVTYFFAETPVFGEIIMFVNDGESAIKFLISRRDQ